MDNKVKKFFRHRQIGPGIQTGKDGDLISINFIKPDGTFEDKIYTFNLSDLRIKEIPEDSFGALFVKDTQNIFDLIENHDPKLVELFLVESGGKANLSEIKTIFEPILKERKVKWHTWWKKTAQKLRSLKSVSYDNKKKIYSITDHDITIESSFLLEKETIQLLPQDELLKLFQSIIHNPKMVQVEKQEEVGNILFGRVIEMFNQTSPRDSSATVLLAISQILSEIYPPNIGLESKIREWLERDTVNLLGIRDSKIRNYSLQILSKIEWSEKIRSISIYVISEESSEQNRSTALLILWGLLKDTISLFMDSFLSVINEMKFPDKSPSLFLSARTNRIVQGNLQFLSMINKKNDFEDLLEGICKIILALYKKHYKPPFDTESSLSILNVWFKFFEKANNFIPKEINWILWTSFEPIFTQCSVHGRLRFFHEKEITKKWSDQIITHLINLSNNGDKINADILYQIIEMMITTEKILSIIDIGFKNHKFTTKEGQEWAISKTLTRINTEGSNNQKASEIFLGILGKQRSQDYKGSVEKDIAGLILLFQERGKEILNSIQTFEKIVRVYEPVNLEQIEVLKSFYSLLENQILRIINDFQVDYIGKAGEIHPYDPNRHHVIQESETPFLYIEIVRGGIGRWINESQFEVIEKAIVKPIIGRNQ